jgi:hypothetical protein
MQKHFSAGKTDEMKRFLTLFTAHSDTMLRMPAGTGCAKQS